MKRYAQLLGTPEAWVGTTPASWQAVDTSATCRTVVVDVGQVGAPQYVLTQAQAFDAKTTGRAVPRAVDPCDPADGRHRRERPVAPDRPTTRLGSSDRCAGRRAAWPTGYRAANWRRAERSASTSADRG